MNVSIFFEVIIKLIFHHKLHFISFFLQKFDQYVLFKFNKDLFVKWIQQYEDIRRKKYIVNIKLNETLVR